MTDVELAIAHLEKMLKHPRPAFICAAAGQRSGERFLARLKHAAAAPVSKDDLSWLARDLGAQAEPYGALYAFHDGMLLFQPLSGRAAHRTPSRDGGFEYFPARELQMLSAARLREAPAAKPADASDLLAFARVPLSKNLICIRKIPPHAGELVEWNHDAPPDGCGVPPLLEELLVTLAYDAATFLHQSGGYTRYSDGQTDTQWIPIRYVENADALTDRELAEEPLPEWFQ